MGFQYNSITFFISQDGSNHDDSKVKNRRPDYFSEGHDLPAYVSAWCGLFVYHSKHWLDNNNIKTNAFV